MEGLTLRVRWERHSGNNSNGKRDLIVLRFKAYPFQQGAILLSFFSCPLQKDIPQPEGEGGKCLV